MEHFSSVDSVRGEVEEQKRRYIRFNKNGGDL